MGLNQFTLTRGYLTVTKEITPWLAARSTTDIFQDTDAGASSNGSWVVREKYLYAELRPPNAGNVLTQNKAKSVWPIPPGMILKRRSTLTAVKALSPLNGPPLTVLRISG